MKYTHEKAKQDILDKNWAIPIPIQSMVNVDGSSVRTISASLACEPSRAIILRIGKSANAKGQTRMHALNKVEGLKRRSRNGITPACMLAAIIPEQANA